MDNVLFICTICTPLAKGGGWKGGEGVLPVNVSICRYLNRTFESHMYTKWNT